MIGSLMRIDLIKYDALGNDYLVLDLPAQLDQVVDLLPAICDRHHGLGSDGLLAFDPQAMTLRIFNPDRSEAQKSGNGLRIAAAHAVLQHAAGDRFELRTPGGPNPVRVLARNGGEVVTEVDIGRPSFRAADLPAPSRQCSCRSATRTASSSTSRSPWSAAWSWVLISNGTHRSPSGPTSSCSRCSTEAVSASRSGSAARATPLRRARAQARLLQPACALDLSTTM